MGGIADFNSFIRPFVDNITVFLLYIDKEENMKKIYFKNLNKYYGQEITVEGFVDSIRDLQFVQFLIIRDTTGKLQITVEKN